MTSWVVDGSHGQGPERLHGFGVHRDSLCLVGGGRDHWQAGAFSELEIFTEGEVPVRLDGVAFYLHEVIGIAQGANAGGDGDMRARFAAVFETISLGLLSKPCVGCFDIIQVFWSGFHRVRL